MKKPLPAHRNYSNIEIVLLFTILFMVAAIGLYVHNAKNDADLTLTQASAVPNSAPYTASRTAPDVNVELAGNVYTPANKIYSVRLADGWKLTRNRVAPDTLATLNNTNLTPSAGVAPVVTETSSGSDGSSGFFMSLNDTDKLPVVQGVKQANLATNDGLTVTKYVYTETANQSAGIGSLAKGGIEYTYLISSGDKTLSVQYSINPDETNYRDTVETVVKSVRFN